MCNNIDIDIIQGDTLRKNYKIFNHDDTDFDLTGYTVHMDIKKNIGDTPLISLSTGSGITVTGNSIDVVYQLNNTMLGTYRYDLEIRKVGDIKTLFQGRIVIKPQITVG